MLAESRRTSASSREGAEVFDAESRTGATTCRLKTWALRRQSRGAVRRYAGGLQHERDAKSARGELSRGAKVQAGESGRPSRNRMFWNDDDGVGVKDMGLKTARPYAEFARAGAGDDIRGQLMRVEVNEGIIAEKRGGVNPFLEKNCYSGESAAVHNDIRESKAPPALTPKMDAFPSGLGNDRGGISNPLSRGDSG